ncbi:hypothetical Protein psc4_00090 [Candidatus Phytoplasma solani]
MCLLNYLYFNIKKNTKQQKKQQKMIFFKKKKTIPESKSDIL